MAKPGSQRHLARRRLVLAGATVGLLAGCGRGPPPVDPFGPKAERVAGLWWLMFWILVAVLALVIVLLVLALACRRSPGRGRPLPRPRWLGSVAVPGAGSDLGWFEGMEEPGSSPRRCTRYSRRRAASATRSSTATS